MTNNTVTTDSTASEEDISVPPPLPAKSRESSDYSNLPNNDDNNTGTISRSPGKYKNKPLPALPTAAVNSSYDYVEARNFLHRGAVRPPTPPPKPSRNSKYVSM